MYLILIQMIILSMEENEVSYPVYSPASVIGIFSNALKLNATVNLIYLKGRYVYAGGRSCGKYYYDLLFDRHLHFFVVRSKITNNGIYTLRGFIEKIIKILPLNSVLSRSMRSFSITDMTQLFSAPCFMVICKSPVIFIWAILVKNSCSSWV